MQIANRLFDARPSRSLQTGFFLAHKLLSKGSITKGQESGRQFFWHIAEYNEIGATRCVDSRRLASGEKAWLALVQIYFFQIAFAHTTG